MEQDLLDSASRIEAALAVGDCARARQLLRNLQLENVSRRTVLHFARVARRAELPSLGLRWLRYLSRGDEVASHEEKTEYAHLLLKLGLSTEALAWLEGIDTGGVPEALLVRASAHVSRWEFSVALPLLESFLRQPGLDARQVGEARVYVAEANVFGGNFQRADNEITALLGNRLLEPSIRTKLYCLGAAVAVAHRQWEKAMALLSQSRRAIKGVEVAHDFQVRQWESIARLGADLGPDALLALDKIKDEAHALRLWESARLCDAYRAVLTRDVECMRHVYHGTRYPAFRSWLLGHFPEGVLEAQAHVWIPNGNRTAESIVDMGDETRGAVLLGVKEGSLTHRLCLVLCSDFYRPFRLVELFRELYPGERFAGDSSLLRVHHTIKKLRTAFRRASLPLQIHSLPSGFFRLGSHQPIGLKVRAVYPQGGQFDFRVARIRSEFGGTMFSTVELARAMAASERTARRVLREAMQMGKIARARHGSKLFYRVIS